MPIPYTRAQLAVLEESYSRTTYLTTLEQARLGPLVNLSDAQLRNWFKNKRRAVLRRQREKADAKDGSHSSSSDRTVEAIDRSDSCSTTALLEQPDWTELGFLLDCIEPLPVVDERFILTSPRFDTVTPSFCTPGFHVHGHISQLDRLSAAPRMAVWVKELCQSVGIDAPSIKLFVHERMSGAILLDQVCGDCSLEAEPWFPKDGLVVESDGRLLGVGMDCRYSGGPVTDEMRWKWALYNEKQDLGDVRTNFERAKARDLALLGGPVTNSLIPGKFCEASDIATQRTSRVQAVFSLPVVCIDGTLEGVVQIGVRHSIHDAALNNFMSSIALALRQPLPPVGPD